MERMPVTKKIRGKLGESLEVSAEPASLKVPTGQALQLDNDVTKRVEKAHKKMTQYVHTLANEPTLGLYHVQEHIRRAVPKCVDIKLTCLQKELVSTAGAVENVSQDTGYTVATLKELEGQTSLTNALAHARRALAAMEGAGRGPSLDALPSSASQPSLGEAKPKQVAYLSQGSAPKRAGTAPDARLTSV